MDEANAMMESALPGYCLLIAAGAVLAERVNHWRGDGRVPLINDGVKRWTLPVEYLVASVALAFSFIWS